MKKLYTFLCAVFLLIVFTPGHSPALADPKPIGDPVPLTLYQDETAGSPLGTTTPSEKSALSSSLSQTRRSPLWRVAADYPYTSHVYTHSDLLIFGYSDGTDITVTNSIGNVIWSGTISDGDHVSLTPGGGIFLVAGTQPFSLVVGDQLTEYVWGYYALDQYGRGLSTRLHTYQANWQSNTFYDPHFIVFAYEDNTHATISDTTTGQIIWTGSLDAGEHYDSTSISNQFLTVESDKPVAALSYTDQGYFVPSENGTFVGHTFHTFAGNSGEWPEYLNVIAYENTSVTLIDSTSGIELWSGVASSNEVLSFSGVNNRFITVETSNAAAVSVQPAPNTFSTYYHSLYAQDSTGTGIGTRFVLPALGGAALVFFSYEDGSQITIEDENNNVVYSGILNQGDWDSIVTTHTIYSISSTAPISTILDWGDFAGADFAPVHYSTMQVDILTPNGDNYSHGETMLVAAYVSQLNQPVTDASVTGRVEITGPADALLFSLNDEGKHGDLVANDAIYSTEVPLPDALMMPSGSYLIYVTASKTQVTGTINSGTGVSNFSVNGTLEQAPTVAVDVSSSSLPVSAGDTIEISGNVTYLDGNDYSETVVTARITKPDLSQVNVTLNYQSPGTWVGTYQVLSGGAYFIDLKAQPPTITNYAAGYASKRLNVLHTNTPVTVSLSSLKSFYARNESIWIEATVTASGNPIDQATVLAEISPGDIILPLAHTGDGKYATIYGPPLTGTYNVTIYAFAPFYASGETQGTFTVTNSSQAFSTALDTFLNINTSSMNSMLGTAHWVAQDGDYFTQQIAADLVQIGSDLIFGVFRVYYDSQKVLSSISSSGMIHGHTPGLDNFKLIKNGNVPIDGRMFESWSSRMSHALRDSLLNHHDEFTGTFPRWVGPDVFKRATVAYTAKWLGMSTNEFVETYVTDSVADKASQLQWTQPLESGFYAVIESDVVDKQMLLEDYATATLATMPPLGANEDAYIYDLQQRSLASIHMAGGAFTRNSTLFWAQDNREAGNDLTKKLVEILLHQALRVLVGIYTDGPGVVMLDTAWTATELVGDLKRLQEDVQMAQFAGNSLLRIAEDEDKIWMNAGSGLIGVRHGRLPQTAKGEIVSIQHISYGENCWLVKWCEREIVARITIHNTGSEPARFVPRACYYGTRRWDTIFFSHCIEEFRRLDNTTDKWIEIPANQTRTVELVFKDERGNDIAPPDDTMINYVLFASNATGTFFADSDGLSFNPIEIPWSAFSTGTMANYYTGLANVNDSIPYPIYLSAIPGGDGIEQYLHVEVMNGFDFPINATIAQPIPADVEITVPGGGTMENEQIVWRTIIQPRDSFGIDFAIAVPGLPTETVTIPATILSFYSTVENDTVTFPATSVEVSRRLPLRAIATMPTTFIDNITVPVKTENLWDTAATIDLTMTLYDEVANPIKSTVQTFQLCARCIQNRTLTMSTNVPHSAYAIEITMTVYGHTEIVDATLLSGGKQYIYLPITVK